jgi:dTDP-4-amino-4,6-dideoxygalactose transaminase
MPSQRQIENIERIQQMRLALWERYHENFSRFAADYGISLPYIPAYATNNAHMFYIVCRDIQQRTGLIRFLKEHDILPVFHYLSLHKSAYYQDKHDGRELVNADNFTDRLLRLPMYYELTEEQVDLISRLSEQYLLKNATAEVHLRHG